MIAFCDLRFSSSSLVNSNIKWLEKRLAILLTCSFKRLVEKDLKVLYFFLHFNRLQPKYLLHFNTSSITLPTLPFGI